jgi:hypothetical protein
MQTEQKPVETSPETARSSATSPGVRAAAPKAKVFSKYPLPSERTPFATHFEVLARFVTHTRNGQEPIGADKVEGSGVPVQAAQMNVKFLASIGLLKMDSRGLYLPTHETVKLVNAKTVGDDRARPILRAVLQGAWFAEIATSVLKTRPVVTDDQLIGELALAAQTNKEKKGAALQVLVDYLVWSDVLVRDERGLTLSDGATLSQPAQAGTSAAGSMAEPLSVPLSEKRPGIAPPSPNEAGGWHIIQTEDFFLKVRSDPDVVEDLREQLSLLSKKIQRIRLKSRAASKPPAEPVG